MAVVCRAKPAFPPPTTLSPIPSLDTATEDDLERGESGLRKRSRSHSTGGGGGGSGSDGEHGHGDGFFHKLFRKRSGSSAGSTKSDEGKKEGKGKEEEDPRRHSLLGDAAGASHVSLNKQDLDEAHPVGIITLEDGAFVFLGSWMVLD